MRKLAVILGVLLTAASCNAISNIIHDDQIVARVGDKKLYLSEVRRFIPEFASPEDSINLVMQYVNTWATDLLYLNVASRQLSKSEMDVTRELESYRRSLLKYRYEQRYLADRLDTVVTMEQTESYYKSHRDLFELERPVLKVRFADVVADSPQMKDILRLMRSEDQVVFDTSDSLFKSAVIKFYDKSDTWVDAMVLAKDFGVDWVTMLSAIDDDMIRIRPEGSPDVKMAYICDIRREGDAPVEYCTPRIRDLIMSSRRHELLIDLEQDLLTDALDRKQFVIY